MMKKYALKMTIFLTIISKIFIVSGCSIEEINRTKVCDLEYMVLSEEEVPDELKIQIEEKKAADFKLTYRDDAYLYIVRGYGEKETGGYSIGVRECYLTTNAVVFCTELVGPRKGETVNRNPSFPYIVVKLENQEENVVFE